MSLPPSKPPRKLSLIEVRNDVMAKLLQTSAGLTPASLVLDPPVEQAPMTIKQILAQLDGVFPMDEAVIHGKRPVSYSPLVMN